MLDEKEVVRSCALETNEKEGVRALERMPVKIGVLALQGDFAEHIATFKRCNTEATCTEIRKVEQLEGLDGLVIPGGESTVMLKLLKEFGMFDAVRQFGNSGVLPVGHLNACVRVMLLASVRVSPCACPREHSSKTHRVSVSRCVHFTYGLVAGMRIRACDLYLFWCVCRNAIFWDLRRMHHDEQVHRS